MDALIKILTYILDYITSVPASSWYVLGAVLGSSSVVIGIVAWINRKQFLKHGERLKSQFIALNVIFWSTVTTVLSFVLTNGTTFASFLPFLGTHMPQIIALSTVLYQISKGLKQWWSDRKARVPISNSNLPDFSTLVPSVTSQTTVSGRPSSSMGATSAGMDITPPPANLFD